MPRPFSTPANLSTRSAFVPREDFRLFLQQELVRRCEVNPKYSLRAFARYLSLEGSHLSKILRGERPVRHELLARLGLKLGLSPSEIEAYGAASEQRRRERGGRASARPRHSYMQISQDTFESIEDWRHYAILELMKVDEFRGDPRWLASALKVSVSEARAFTERLQRIGLLFINEDGTWVDRSEGFSTDILSDQETTAARRRSQKKILQLGIEAIDSVPFARRDQSSMMMATHSSKIAEAKKMIREFRLALCAFLEDTGSKDAVFQLSVSLFPVTGSETAASGLERIS